MGPLVWGFFSIDAAIVCDPLFTDVEPWKLGGRLESYTWIFNCMVIGALNPGIVQRSTVRL